VAETSVCDFSFHRYKSVRDHLKSTERAWMSCYTTFEKEWAVKERVNRGTDLSL